MIGLFALIGCVVTWLGVSLIAFKLFTNLYFIYLAPMLTPFRFEAKPDSWAIITGSTDGIGLEYAKKLAEKRFNLLLISRNQKKLENVREAILDEFPSCPSIEVLVFDFSSRDYKSVEEALRKLPTIHVLINNVGHAYWTPEFFDKIQPWSEVEKLIDINLFSMTKMCYLALPQMEKQMYGVIVNISSFAAYLPVPCLNVYGAAKTYVDYLSQALNIEYRSKGILVQSVLPQFVATNMTNLKASFGAPSAKTYVDSAFKTIGYENRTSGYWNHRLKKLGTEILMTLNDTFLPSILMKLALLRRRVYYEERGLQAD